MSKCSIFNIVVSKVKSLTMKIIETLFALWHVEHYVTMAVIRTEFFCI